MSTGETSRQKTARILPDYYRRADRLQRGKMLLAALALPLAIAYAAWGAWRPEIHHSPGPLTAVHATWDGQCQVCHASFQPIRDDAVTTSPHSAKLLAEKCGSCHRGPDHHASQKRDEVAGCASCHADHRGRDASLLQISDRNCTRCHDGLSTHSTGTSEPPDTDPHWSKEHIRQFDAEHHPQFRSARTDPGKLKFSHWRHLAAGLNLGAGDRFPPKKWADLEPRDRDRYAKLGIVNGEPVQLNCAACHQLDAAELAPPADTETSAAISLPRAAGAAMLPVTYEKHCRACHPLPFDPESVGTPTSPTIPHGRTARQIREFLRNAFTQRYLDANPDIREKHIPLAARDVPNQLEPVDRATARQWVDDKIAASDRYLRGTCSVCHELNGRPTELDVTPTRVPQIWLTHAKFDHRAHRAADCRVCHAGAYEHGRTSSDKVAVSPEVLEALDNQTVLIPQLDVCTQCHAPRRWDGTGGARFDCVECHRYHNGDKPLEGLGAPSRGAAHAGGLQDFFNRANWPGESSDGLAK